MPIRSLTIYGAPGLNFVQDFDIQGVKILGVKREGVGYTEAAVAPVNQEFQYFSSLGRIEFDVNIPFTGTTFGRVNQSLSERVWILYKALV